MIQNQLIAGLLVLVILASGRGFGASPVKLNDREVVAVILATNTVSADIAKMAQAKAARPEVKRFAEQMISDHGNANKQAADILKSLDLRPQESETSRSMKSSGADTIKRLSSLKGMKFDRDYLNGEVAFHQAVLNTIDKTLLPNAKDPKVKVLLQEIRPNVTGHLEHARQLQSRLIDEQLPEAAD